MKKRIDERTTNVSWWQLAVPPSLLAVVTTVFYYPSLKYPFQFDDLANITKKFDIRMFSFWNELFRTPRWLGELLNKWNFSIGRFDPWYYRTVNLSIHVMTGLLVYYLVYVLCVRQKSQEFLARHAVWISSLTAALFLLHPLQTQTVSYAIQARLEGLAALFVVGVLLLFVEAFFARTTVVRLCLATLGLGVAFLSCGTKEIVVVTPFLLALVDWFFISEWRWEKFRAHLWYYVALIAVIMATLLYYLKFKFLADVVTFNTGTVNNRGNILTNSPVDLIKPLPFFISQFKVILHYLQLFVLPIGMSVEYDWKLSESLFAPDAFFPMLAVVTLICVALYNAIKKGERLASFGLAWFLIGVAPRSSIIPSPELLCDYKVYLASIGVFFGMAVGLAWLIERINGTHWFAQLISANRVATRFASVGLCVIIVGSATLARNRVWGSTVSFWEDIVLKAPGKARAHNNLGVALSEAGDFDRAIPHYLQAIQLDKVYSDPWSNLAVAYSVKGKDDEAIESLRQAIRIFPSYPEAYNNLGTLILKKKEYDKAEEALKCAINLRPHYGKAHFNLGRLYLEKNEKEKAWGEFCLATRGDLDTPEGFYALGQVGIQLKKYDEAIKAFETVASRSGGMNPQVAFSLANAHYLAGHTEEATTIYESLHKQFPQDGRFAYNLAESLFTKGKYDEAMPLFQIAGNLGEQFPTAYTRVANCLEKTKGFDAAIACLENFMTKGVGQRAQEELNRELGRLRLQHKINSGDGTIRMSDLQDAFSGVHGVAKKGSKGRSSVQGKELRA